MRLCPLTICLSRSQVRNSFHVNMSGGLDILSLKEDDITKMLVATTHLGSENVNFQMEQYVYKRRADGVNILNLGKTWEKLQLAARAIVAIDNPSDVSTSAEFHGIPVRRG